MESSASGEIHAVERVAPGGEVNEAEAVMERDHLLELLQQIEELLQLLGPGNNLQISGHDLAGLQQKMKAAREGLFESIRYGTWPKELQKQVRQLLADLRQLISDFLQVSGSSPVADNGELIQKLRSILDAREVPASQGKQDGPAAKQGLLEEGGLQRGVHGEEQDVDVQLEGNKGRYFSRGPHQNNQFSQPGCREGETGSTLLTSELFLEKGILLYGGLKKLINSREKAEQTLSETKGSLNTILEEGIGKLYKTCKVFNQEQQGRVNSVRAIAGSQTGTTGLHFGARAEAFVDDRKQPGSGLQRDQGNNPAEKLLLSNLTSLEYTSNMEMSKKIIQESPLARGLQEQVIAQIRTQLKQNKKTAELQLYPRELGRLQIKLKIDNRNITARFFVENPEVKSLLQSQIHNLRRTFVQQGYNWQEATVDFTGQDQGPSHGYNRGGERRSFRNSSSGLEDRYYGEGLEGEFALPGVEFETYDHGQYIRGYRFARVNYLV